ncbi:VanZ family protein [Chryseobacterium balustinum]|uniref:VanZ like family n=2 Tax=Chryseobacterium balustinum TaxID=246 RepID=A0AAX2IL76_9FLAO|nr:VanZ family protein [Chryseobacterium balustinum]AZB27970.1 VanZ family protein [Chryseobacterium balustinum]SKB54804.1 VanZ like family protein [Chryseobacterium balustinum]SQA89811.1 VanZ like family [Chryseobacterium balustinum]
MLKKYYKFIILPYTIFLLYLMFFGMGRLQYEDHIIRIKPIVSTVWFIHETISWFDIIKIVLGNVVMFIPFGFLGWVFPQLNNLKRLIITFVSTIVIVEALQYFSRLGVFDVDDVILNTFGVFLGWQMKRILEIKFSKFVLNNSTKCIN